MKFLVIGDEIRDQYKFCKATRLCPEACAPVLHVEEQRTSPGGAANVVANLRSLTDFGSVDDCYGSISTKLRIYADKTLICRIDDDSTILKDILSDIRILKDVCKEKYDAIVISDYGKGTFNKYTSDKLFDLFPTIPFFVDSKPSLSPWMKRAFAIFPNEHEHASPYLDNGKTHVIRKLGHKGCFVNGELVATVPQHVYDVSGAGDVFLAAFVWTWVRHPNSDEKRRLHFAAKVANVAAGISVRHLGTYVVKREELEQELAARG